MDEKSAESLSVKAKEWYELEEKYRGQLEKACYAGIAIIWIFATPVLANSFAINPEKLQYLQLLIYSLICFVSTIVMYLSVHLFLIFWNHYRYHRNRLLIVEGKRTLFHSFAKPNKMTLGISSIGFILVILGFSLIVAHVCINVY